MYYCIAFDEITVDIYILFFFLILCSTTYIYGKDPPVTLIVYILNFATNLVIYTAV